MNRFWIDILCDQDAERVLHTQRHDLLQQMDSILKQQQDLNSRRLSWEKYLSLFIPKKNQMSDLQDSLEICTFTSKLSSLGSNPNPAINCHPGVSQAGLYINVCHPSDWR